MLHRTSPVGEPTRGITALFLNGERLCLSVVSDACVSSLPASAALLGHMHFGLVIGMMCQPA
mgnify:CR=1 FL=1